MKILWICEIMLPDVAKKENKPIISIQGWLSGMAKSLSIDTSNELAIVMPSFWGKDYLIGTTDYFRYYCYPQNLHKQHLMNLKLKKFLKEVIDKEQPDVIHVWGTEYPNQWAVFEAVGEKYREKIVVSIQGLVHIYAKHFFCGIPVDVLFRFGIKEMIKRQNIYLQMKEYLARGVYEKKILSTTKNVIGRTEWDYNCVKIINPDVEYFHCNETLRSEFYGNQWNYDKCEKNRIFYSACSYPIKGFHLMLKALPAILERHPQTHLYVTGTDTSECNLIEKIIVNDSYRRYLIRLIKKLGIEEKVTFLGNLNAEMMKNEFLKCNVFVSASSIENSPNSVGEAMLLGVPVVASFVGGMQSIIEHNAEGILFQQDAEYMLSSYVCQLFDDPEKAIRLGHNARIKAVERHDPIQNERTLKNIYNYVVSANKNVNQSREM